MRRPTNSDPGREGMKAKLMNLIHLLWNALGNVGKVAWSGDFQKGYTSRIYTHCDERHSLSFVSLVGIHHPKNHWTLQIWGVWMCFLQGSGISKPPDTWDPMILRANGKIKYTPWDDDLESQTYKLTNHVLVLLFWLPSSLVGILHYKFSPIHMDRLHDLQASL